jgi:hypothetical protein
MRWWGRGTYDLSQKAKRAEKKKRKREGGGARL